MSAVEEDGSYDAWLSEQELSHPGRSEVDWHAQVDRGEPFCGPDEWRCKNRWMVVKMSNMTFGHLESCIRLAGDRPQHKSKFAELLLERINRQ